MTSDELNGLVAEGLVAAEVNEEALRAEYERQILAAGGRAASALRRSENLVAAAEEWVPPPWAELLAAATLGLAWEKIRKRRRKIAANAAEPLLAAIGETNAVEVALAEHTPAVTDMLGREIRYALQQAKDNSLSVRQTARLLETEIADLARWQANMLARTDMLTIANASTHQAVAQANERFHKAGQAEFRTKRWVTAHDERVRQTHAMAEGQTRPFNEPFQVGGSLLQHPCDPAGNPNETWNCRCVATYEEGAALVASDDPPLAALPSHETSREDTMDAESGNAGSHVAEVKITGQFGVGVFAGGDENPISFMPFESFPAWATTNWPAIPETAVASGVTITVLESDEDTEVVGEPIPWEGVLAVEGVQSGDSTYAPRILLLESVGHRELPLPLMAQLVTADGHDGARLCGQIQNIWRADRPDLGEGAVAIMGSGVFSATAFGQEIAGYVDDKSLRGVSVDLVAAKYQVVTVEDLTPIPDDEVDLDVMMNGGYLLGLMSGEIGAATLCPLQALADATIALVASGEQRAVAFSNLGLWLTSNVMDVLIAAAAPIAPPRSCFEMPEPNELTPMTITDEGFVFGHAATWECHEAYRDRCVMAPRSRTGLAYFHTGEMLTAEGDLLPVGRWTVGGGHASINESRVGANAHYDNASTVGAYLRGYEGRHGLWTCGVLKSNVTPEQLRDMRGNPPSGDWRDGELILVHSVPVQGLPVFRHEARVMVASDGREVVTALITPPVECSCDDGSDYAIRIEALAQFANLD